MKRLAILPAFCLLLGTLLLTTGTVAADGPEPVVTKVSALAADAAAWDGKQVTVRGEVVGDIMMRGTHGWITVSEPSGDIGVWAAAEQLRQITHVGRYSTRGDTVLVTGVFNRADREHGGDPDLHAGTLVVEQPGGVVERPVPAGKLWLAAGVMGLAGALALVLWQRKGRVV